MCLRESLLRDCDLENGTGILDRLLSEESSESSSSEQKSDRADCGLLGAGIEADLDMEFSFVLNLVMSFRRGADSLISIW